MTVNLTHVRLGYTQEYNTQFFHSSLIWIYLKVTQHKVVFRRNEAHINCYNLTKIIQSFLKKIQ